MQIVHYLHTEETVIQKLLIKLTINIGNSMVSSAMWEKHAQVSFSKTPKCYCIDHTTFVDCLILITHFALLFGINCTEITFE